MNCFETSSKELYESAEPCPISRKKESKAKDSKNRFYIGKSKTSHERTLFLDLDNTLVLAVLLGCTSTLEHDVLVKASYTT